MIVLLFLPLRCFIHSILTRIYLLLIADTDDNCVGIMENCCVCVPVRISTAHGAEATRLCDAAIDVVYSSIKHIDWFSFTDIRNEHQSLVWILLSIPLFIHHLLLPYTYDFIKCIHTLCITLIWGQSTHSDSHRVVRCDVLTNSYESCDRSAWYRYAQHRHDTLENFVNVPEYANLGIRVKISLLKIDDD